MPGLMERGRVAMAAFRSSTPRSRSGTPKLVDPEDPKPEVLPVDLVKPPALPNEQQRRIVEHIRDSYKAASIHRRQRSYLWEQCKRFDEGEQWFLVDDKKGVVDTRKRDEIERCITFNHVTRLVTKMVAMATQSEPEAYPVPVADTPLDREASQVAEAIIADEYRKVNINDLRARQARSAIVQTSSYRYWRWDKDKPALIPKYDPLTGELIRAVKDNVGGLVVEMLPGEYVFWDPAAQSKDHATWCIIARIKPIVWLQETYREGAYGVQPDVTLNSDGVALRDSETSNSGLLTDGFRGGIGTKKLRPNAALTLEYLEKPNPKHPQGVYAVVAGEKLVYPPSPWPWADKEHWPLAEMAFLPLETSPHAQSAVEHLIEAQTLINRELSRIAARLDKDKRVIYVQRLSEIGADAFEELRDMIKIYYNPGSAPPTPSNLPPISPDHFTMMDRALDFMQTFSGIVDVLNGEAPPGVTAGISIDLLVREASSQFKPFISSLEQCEVDFMRGVVSEYAEKAPIELMIGMDRKGTPRGSAENRPALARAMSLQALADGGMVDIYLTPGSGLPRSEAGKKQERMANYQAGLYGAPGSPEALRIYWATSDESESHKVLESLDEQEQGAIAQLNDALMQAQQQIEQLKQELQSKGQQAQADPEIQAQLAEHQAQLKAQADQAADERKAQLQAQLDERKGQLAADADERKAKLAITLEALKMQGEAARQSYLKSDVQPKTAGTQPKKSPSKK